MSHWHDDVPAARQSFRCGGTWHEVVWDRGRLRLSAHASIAGERVLRAFGGGEPGCLAVVERWVSAVRDTAFLEVWAKLERPERVRMQFYGQYVRDSFIRDDVRLAPLAELSDAMLDRLAFAVVCRSLRHDAFDSPSRQVIAQATTARVRRALVRSLTAAGVRGGVAPLIRLGCSVAEDVEASGTVAGRNDSHAQVAVRRSWLLDVYAREMDVIDGRLVLGAEPYGRTAYRVRMLTWVPDGGGLRARTEEAVVRKSTRWRIVPG